jgi:hypothetical protein
MVGQGGVRVERGILQQQVIGRFVKRRAIAPGQDASNPRPDDCDERAVFYKSIGGGQVLEVRLLTDPIELHADPVRGATGDHLDIALLAMRHVGRRPQAFQHIAQLPPAGTDVVGLIAHPDQIVE